VHVRVWVRRVCDSGGRSKVAVDVECFGYGEGLLEFSLVLMAFDMSYGDFDQ